MTLESLGVTQCYYIAANGSDSNDGASEASGHPWAHLPGMQGWTGSHAPAAGEGYIIRGGDTWTAAQFSIRWNWGGTSSNPIYIGVDPAWYSGSSWARPIWTCGGTACGSMDLAFLEVFKPYVILDNIEFTGLLETTTAHPNYYNGCSTNLILENTYMHGWSHDSTFVAGSFKSAATGWGCGENATGDVWRYNWVDGSDTDQYQILAAYQSPPIAYSNVMRYVAVGLDGTGDNWHDNLFEYFAGCGGNGCGHQDSFYLQCGTGASPIMLFYNNIARHTTPAWTGGAVKFYINGNCPSPGLTGYAFNNVMYDVYPGNMWDTGGHLAQNYGNWYIFNNTTECGTDSVLGSCGLGDGGNKQGGQFTGGSMNLYLSNNHWIEANRQPVLSCTQSTWVCSESNAVYQTLSQANSQGYTSTSAYAFQPTQSGGSTVVNVGKNNQALCAAIAAYDSLAGAACQNDTTYACAYDATNHVVVCPARTPIARPTGAPNIGAYQFNAAQSSTPNPPEGLTAVVN